MAKIHFALQAKTFPNCRKLAEKLEVSEKTIQRDIEFMRDRQGFPIAYDQLHFGFYYTKPVMNFPGMEVTEGELIALFIAQKALEQYHQTVFEKPLRAAFQKISEGLKDSVDFQWNENEMDAAISFKGIGATLADLAVFEAVSGAVLRNTELQFEYKKLKSTRYETRHVQPYHLGCIENQWYLFANDLQRGQLRTFALTRIRNVLASGKRFQRPADFSIAAHLSQSFGVFTENKGARHRIRLRFDAFAARLVSERQWHATQKIKPLAHGELELSLTLGNLEEIERWILSWGAHAHVLEPKKLADRIRKIARTISQF